ncbi:MAG: hypothetical protein DCC46_00505 [Armatimonadetes bacterium]|nr:MAG: hypothetical protein DCC46_00505 [Armatimonadota bacterium]
MVYHLVVMWTAQALFMGSYVGLASRAWFRQTYGPMTPIFLGVLTLAYAFPAGFFLTAGVFRGPKWSGPHFFFLVDGAVVAPLMAFLLARFAALRAKRIALPTGESGTVGRQLILAAAIVFLLGAGLSYALLGQYAIHELQHQFLDD